MALTYDRSVRGTLDHMEPLLRARGYTAVLTMAGEIDLTTFDPYGMRRVGSVNIQTEKWKHHIYRGILATGANGQAYLADANHAGEPLTPEPPFVGGLFPLVRLEA